MDEFFCWGWRVLAILAVVAVLGFISMLWVDKTRFGSRGLFMGLSQLSHRDGDLIAAAAPPEATGLLGVVAGYTADDDDDTCGLLVGSRSVERLRCGVCGAASWLPLAFFSSAPQRIALALAFVVALSTTMVVVAGSAPSVCTKKTCSA